MEEQKVNKRCLGEVNAILEYAKLERSEIKPDGQSIYFSEELDNDCIKLLELDKVVLQALEAGEKVVIRGDKEDLAVLCTDGQTYDIKQGEISNAMLLLPNMSFGCNLPDTGQPDIHFREVGSVVQTFFELRPCKPRLQKLREMLHENQYSGQASEADEDHQGRKYTMHDLLNLVQASEAEIKTALADMQALLIDGCYRVLEFDFLVLVMTHLLQLCDENDWTNSGIPIDQASNILLELFPRNVTEHVVKAFADKIDTADANDDEEPRMQIDIDLYQLNEDKVCRFFAEQILKHARKFNLAQFLSTWEKSVPDGLKTNLHQLEGMALVDRDCSPEVVSYLPVESLPEETADRFNHLFKLREKWSLEEITPYISGLTTEKMDVKAMLTKFARASHCNGIRVYNSRKPVT